MGKLRLLPLVAFATFFLLILKTFGLFLNLGFATGQAPASADSSQSPIKKNNTVEEKMSIVKNFPLIDKPEINLELVDDITTGEVDKSEKKDGASDQEKDTSQNVLSSGPELRSKKSEFAILQSLAKRREKLDEREKQLILQRNLLKAAEKRLEARIAEIKSMESRVQKTARQQKDTQSEQYSKLIQMYSKMKPADAARIFNRLDMDVLIGLVQGMKARAMSSILSAMDPAKAELLTLRIANEGKAHAMNTKSLPKIKNQ